MVAHFYMRLKARPRSRAQTHNYQVCELVQYITVATRLWQRSHLSSSGFCSSDCYSNQVDCVRKLEGCRRGWLLPRFIPILKMQPYWEESGLPELSANCINAHLFFN